MPRTSADDGPGAPAARDPAIEDPALGRSAWEDPARGVSAHAVLRAGSGEAHAPGGPRWRRRSPAVVFLAGVLITCAVAAFIQSSGRDRARARFDHAMDGAQDRIAARLATHVTLLRGAAALLTADTALSGEAFSRYVARLGLAERYPGVRAVGWARRQPAASDDALVVTYLEPLDDASRGAVGFDMARDPVRRAAMERARDLGAPAATALVELRTTEASPPRGLLLYLPVYRADAAVGDVAARRAAFVGHVYAAFRANALFADIFGSEDEPRVDFRAFDGTDTSAAALLVDSRTLEGRAADHGAGTLRETRVLDVGGRPWTLAFTERAALEGGLARDTLALLVLVLGTLVSATLAFLTRAEVRARTRAERSDAMRSRFFAAMSHELRTPINAILGYNDLLLAGVYGPLPEVQEDGIRRSQRAARHLLELVNDVLDLSKLEAGKIDVAPEGVRLDELLEDLLATIRPMARARGCEVTLERAGCALSIRTDPRRLRQILLNLLSNATKFGAGQPVEIRCACLAHGEVPPGGRRRRTAGDAVVISVVDRGPGIAAADQARVFEEFVQLQHPAAAGGTGLGLPISRRLAELLGGTLTVVSAPGAGSAFHVTLPRDDRRSGRR